MNTDLRFAKNFIKIGDWLTMNDLGLVEEIKNSIVLLFLNFLTSR